MLANPERWNRLLTRRRVLISGLTGQDGYYLAQRLIASAAAVGALVPPHEMEAARALAGLSAHVELLQAALRCAEPVDGGAARFAPDLVYHLAAQSSVAASWRQPILSAEVNAMGTLYLLEAIRRHAPHARFVMAGTCDCFDHDAAGPHGVTPETPFRASNPYAISKVMAHQTTDCYRDQHQLHASVAILFNHTSPRRPLHFVERSIVRQAVQLAAGHAQTLTLGSDQTRRDWSWAPELMEAFACIPLLDQPSNLVLASGRLHTTGDWVTCALGQLGLDPQRCLRLDPSRVHGGDRPHTFGNIEPAARLLGWHPSVDLHEMVARLIRHDRQIASL